MFLAALLLSTQLLAIEPSQEESKLISPYSSTNEEIVSVKAVAEETSIQPNKAFWVAFDFTIAKDWHLYWKNPGDAGQGPIVRWTLPQGFTASELTFPAPERYEIDNAVVYGFSNRLILLAQIMPPEYIAEESVDLKAEVDWFGCSTTCIPGSASFLFQLPVGDESTPPAKQVVSLFKQARKALAHDARFTKAKITDSTLEMSVHQDLPFNNIKNVTFFLEQQDIINPHETASWTLSGDKKTLIAKVQSAKFLQSATLYPLSGVLVVEEESVLGPLKSAWSVQIARPSNAPVSSEFEKKYAATKSAQSVDDHLQELESKVWYRKLLNEISHFLKSDFMQILIWAFVGGMILNIMPCVLPVISIKLLHIVQMQNYSRFDMAKHGLIYSFGVLLSFWVLSGAIYILQSFGHVIGWGFQLQEPLFVAFMVIVLFILALSLFGVFEFGISLASTTGSWESRIATKDEAPSYFASFASGVLATFVAAPCTGPLLGSAIGFAATLQPAYSFAIFTALGAGMAFPFLLVSLFPGLTKFLPKPGRWMVTFKELMGFFMLATILWLVWVLDAETENLSNLLLLLSLFTIAFGVWIYGNWGGFDRAKRCRLIAKISALLFVLVGSWLLLSHVHKSRHSGKQELASGEWENFSLPRLEALIKSGKPVFVDVTAKWCLTCQTNGIVLESSKVKEAFKSYGVVKMKADWTSNDETITRYIRSLGRNGVPVYVVYSGQPGAKPQVLPEVITPDIIVEALKRTKND